MHDIADRITFIWITLVAAKLAILSICFHYPDTNYASWIVAALSYWINMIKAFFNKNI